MHTAGCRTRSLARPCLRDLTARPRGSSRDRRQPEQEALAGVFPSMKHQPQPQPHPPLGKWMSQARLSGGFHRLGNARSVDGAGAVVEEDRAGALGRWASCSQLTGKSFSCKAGTQPAPCLWKGDKLHLDCDGLMGSRALAPACLPLRTPGCEIGGADSPHAGSLSPVPPICELIPQGPWAAAGAADPERGRGCYKTAPAQAHLHEAPERPHPNPP